MSLHPPLSQISLGEDSTRQFKADVHNGISLASEMAAFANSNGGTIFIGVADNGSIPGLAMEDVNQLISNAASQLVRNPFLISYVAKGLLPYHGLGSGIKRALEAWPHIDFVDDQEACLFTVTVHRKSVEELELAGDSSVSGQGSPKSSPKSSPKTEEQILTLISEDPSVTTEQLGFVLGISKRAVLRQISKLKAQGHLRRVGPTRGGTGKYRIDPCLTLSYPLSTKYSVCQRH